MAGRARLSLDAFLALPEIEERRLELIDGEVCEPPERRWGRGRIAGILGGALNDVGTAATGARAIIPGSDDRGPSAPLPDVSFYRHNPPADDDWMRTPPDVAVEILSIDQSRVAMRAKIDIYLVFGVKSAWVVDLERESVDIYEDGARRTLTGAARIESRHAPGFSVAVSDLFRAPGRD